MLTLDINAFGIMPFAIGGDEFVGGTICPPHERIKLGVAFAKFLEVFAGILAVGEGFNGIDNAEVVFLLIIVPICAYLPASKQLYLLWHNQIILILDKFSNFPLF